MLPLWDSPALLLVALDRGPSPPGCVSKPANTVLVLHNFHEPPLLILVV